MSVLRAWGCKKLLKKFTFCYTLKTKPVRRFSRPCCSRKDQGFDVVSVLRADHVAISTSMLARIERLFQ